MGIFLLIDCNVVKEGLRTTQCSQCALDALAIDEPLEYARLALDGNLQMWVDAEDSLELWWTYVEECNHLCYNAFLHRHICAMVSKKSWKQFGK